MAENMNILSSTPNFAAQIAAITAYLKENTNKFLALGDYTSPKTKIPIFNHSHAAIGDSRTMELFHSALRWITSNP